MHDLDRLGRVLAFLGGPVRYPENDESADATLTSLLDWRRDHPLLASPGSRPVLTPEEHTDVPLTREQRERRAELLARVRDANRRRH
ncbi:hypothetical protein [Kitasatospora aureofaciens]|uniref:hypothetical protein n=1 Tax=Kitasatospora aureofaciens TaxID=1894 RepID=UPI00381A0375